MTTVTDSSPDAGVTLLPEWLEELLICPACRGAVSPSGNGYLCASCRAYYPLRFGIPDFRLAPDPYITVEEEVAKVRRFTEGGSGYRELLVRYYGITPESPAALHTRYIASMDAAGSRGMGLLRQVHARFPGTPTGTLLEIGCGTAGFPIAATRSGRSVVGVDVALRWLVIASARIAEAGLSIPLVCANAESLPFRNEAFTEAIADAVLEHVRDIRAMRDETLRVLVQGGAFAFTTVNRFSILPEPHVRLPAFGFLPRGMMAKVAWWLRRTPYKANLRSLRQLRSVFAGVANVDIPSYQRNELGEANERLRASWERLSKIPGLRQAVLPVFPQYLITGQKSSPET